MRIVSQDRTMSFNLDNIVLWTQSNMVYAKIGVESKVLGRYESEDRVAEVFEDIHNAYSPVSLVIENLSDEQAKAFIGSQNLKSNIICMPEDEIGGCVTTYENTVYYMPAE